MNRNIFLDCGSNIGQGYESLNNSLSLKNYKIFMFEPNKYCFDILKEKYTKFNLYNKAVWNKNEFRILNIEYPTGGATNIIEENFKIPQYIPNNVMNEWPSLYQATVECIDFSEFLKNNFDENDNIYLKLDIEGAEVEVLKHLINEQTISYVKKIIVEWHFHMRKNNDVDADYFINIFKEKNIEYIQWF